MKCKFGKIERRSLCRVSVLSFLIISAFLSGCGGGSGGGGNGGGNAKTGSQVIITGTVSLPAGMGTAKAASRTTSPEGLYAIANTTVEVYLVDQAGVKIGNTIASTETNGIGSYSISLPQGTEVTSAMIVSVKSGDSTVRAFALYQPADITPVSEFVVSGVLSGGQPLSSYNEKSLSTITKNVVSAASLFTFGNYKNITDAITALKAGATNVESTLRETITQMSAGTYASGCANRIVEFPEECDDGNTANGDGCSPTCRTEVCGNGFLDPSEECDDYNIGSGDGCSSLCKIELCGDKVVNNNKVSGTEECDDGNLANGDACSDKCKFEPAVCGDKIIQNGEDCDIGDILAGDGCSDTCRFEVCGDGTKSDEEECDDGNRTEGDGCSKLCITEKCSDGIVNNNVIANTEECDDGNTSNGDGCSNICKYEPAVCGDKILQHGEACEPPTPVMTKCDYGTKDCQLCTSSCELRTFAGEYCGDGKRYYVDAATQEECEDGNEVDGDGCSKVCVIEFISSTLYIQNACDSLSFTAKLDGVTVGTVAQLSEFRTTASPGLHLVTATFTIGANNYNRDKNFTAAKVNTVIFDCP